MSVYTRAREPIADPGRLAGSLKVDNALIVHRDEEGRDGRLED